MPTSKAAEFISYTDNEKVAIETLKANRGQHLSAKELGIAVALLTSIGKKAVDERPMAEGVERIVLNKEDYEYVCPTCGSKHSYKLYWID